MSRLSADPVAMAGAARTVGASSAALDGASGAVAGALLQVAAAAGSAAGPEVGSAAAEASRRWQVALAGLSAVTADLGTGVERAAACYREVELAGVASTGSGSR